jgi:hypothetical protein
MKLGFGGRAGAAASERDLHSAVLGLLLDMREHWSVEEVVRELEDPPARDVLSSLAAVGLIYRHDEFVFPRAPHDAQPNWRSPAEEAARQMGPALHAHRAQSPTSSTMGNKPVGNFSRYLAPFLAPAQAKPLGGSSLVAP